MPEKQTAPDPVTTKLEWGKIIVPAVIGLVGVVVTAFCGFLTTVAVTLLPSARLSLRQATPTVMLLPTQTAESRLLPTPTLAPTKDLPNISFELLDFNLFLNVPLDVYGKLGGDEYMGIVPEVCWSVYLPEYKQPNIVERREDVQVYYNFVVLSDKPIVLSDISLYLDQYKPPPDPKALAQAVYVYGRGGGEVTAFALKNVNVGSNFKRASLNEGKAYRLEENDSLAFSSTISLVDPGEYRLHIEIQAETFTGDTFAYASDPLSFAWMYMDDLSGIKVYDLGSDTAVRVVKPPCNK